VLPTGILTAITVTGRFRFAAYQFEMDALAASKVVIARLQGFHSTSNY